MMWPSQSAALQLRPSPAIFSGLPKPSSGTKEQRIDGQSELLDKLYSSLINHFSFNTKKFLFTTFNPKSLQRLFFFHNLQLST
jgi:hypothetical protein